MSKHILLSVTLLLAFILVGVIKSVAQTQGDSVFIYHKDGVTVDKYGCLDIVKIAHDTKQAKVYTNLLGDDIPFDTPEINDISKVVFRFAGDAGKDTISVDITNLEMADANATLSTKILFAYLKYYQGKKLLTSTMADVNWNNEGADHEKQLSGKYPAIHCYDFVHIMADGTWINYNDLTPVNEWVARGGVVSLMWHFNVPMTEKDYEEGNMNNVTYSPDKTTWKAANIYVEGTWENKWFYSQMDKVAGVLLKLQDEGVSALWRPFHEASGNMYNNQGWPKTAWFWWGADGAEAYVKLWKTMKTYFEGKGIHNLIWVWTGTAAVGNTDADSPYYPGKENVDIVGADCYGFTLQQLKTQFDGLTALYPDKMITLAECGHMTETQNGTTVITAEMPKMSEVWAAGAKFLYFMPWYDKDFEDGKTNDSKMFPKAYWQDAMGMKDIINLDNWRIDENKE